ncbi:MAG: GAP family protein [Candidatus Parcubacteria bacterium]|nr:GAP family protein [Candidatus Parcubacteria bacterium]
MKNYYKFILVLLLLFMMPVLFLGIGHVLAQQPNSEVCIVGNNGCSEQGLQLATMLENQGLSFALVVVAGLLDGVNPCAIGMLILLLGYLLVFAHDPHRMTRMGLLYIASVFATYFLVGIIFSQFIYQLLAQTWYQEVSHIIKYVIIALIWVAALINIKDFFAYGKWFSLGVSKGEVPFLLKLIKKVDWHATILLGVVVTLFELPCSLPLYIGSIAIMTQTFHYFKTILFLLVYNLMFVTPLFIVFAILVKTHHIFEAKDAQERFNKWMKLSMGIAQILIGIGLLLLK